MNSVEAQRRGVTNGFLQGWGSGRALKVCAGSEGQKSSPPRTGPDLSEGRRKGHGAWRTVRPAVPGGALGKDMRLDRLNGLCALWADLSAGQMNVCTASCCFSVLL